MCWEEECAVKESLCCEEECVLRRSVCVCVVKESVCVVKKRECGEGELDETSCGIPPPSSISLPIYLAI
jgi:hypothetical protein